MDPKRVPRAGRWVIAPHLVDEAFHAKGFVAMDREQGEDFALSQAREGDLTARPNDFERAEDPELHVLHRPTHRRGINCRTDLSAILRNALTSSCLELDRVA